MGWQQGRNWKKGERLKRNISAKPAAGERNLQPNEYISLDHNEQQKELLELRWGPEALLNSITEAGVLWLFPPSQEVAHSRHSSHSGVHRQVLPSP